MSIFGNKEKEDNNSEEKFTFPLASEDQINQSTLAKDIQIHGSIEAKDYINFNGSITGTICELMIWVYASANCTISKFPV